MAFAMTAKQNRTTAIALLVTAIVLSIAVLVGPVYFLHRHYDFYLDKYSDELARYQRIAATRPALEAKLAAVKARDPRKGFLKNTGASLAASEVQDATKNLIEANGGRLVTLQISPHKDDGRFRQVGVNVQMSASVSALRKILYAVEEAQPYLFADNLTVRSNVSYGYKPAVGPDPEILFVQMDVSGFAIAGP